MEYTCGNAAAFMSLLDGQPVVSLKEAAQEMEGITHWHGTTQTQRQFDYAVAEAEIEDCLRWAQNPPEALKVVVETIGVQRTASVRAWSGDSLCYVVTSLLREKTRSINSVRPVLPFLKLFYEALHRFPPSLVFEGALYRAEHGVRTTWDEKVQPGCILEFFAPLSFSTNPESMQDFMSTSGDRTMIVIENGRGYDISPFSIYPEESEVLTESITKVKVLTSQKFDNAHLLVQSGQVAPGLHQAVCKWRSGIEILSGSPVLQQQVIEDVESCLICFKSIITDGPVRLPCKCKLSYCYKCFEGHLAASVKESGQPKCPMCSTFLSLGFNARSGRLEFYTCEADENQARGESIYMTNNQTRKRLTQQSKPRLSMLLQVYGMCVKEAKPGVDVPAPECVCGGQLECLGMRDRIKRLLDESGYFWHGKHKYTMEDLMQIQAVTCDFCDGPVAADDVVWTCSRGDETILHAHTYDICTNCFKLHSSLHVSVP